MSESKALSLADIRIDGGTQPRVSISETHVREYAGHYEAGVLMDPVDVFFDGTAYWLADGFHRFFAAKSIERTCITAIVHPGTRRDAVLFAVGANHRHGIQRTSADKRKAATTLLLDVEWRVWTNEEIARRCGVGHTLVSEIRRSLSVSESEKQEPRTYTTKHGTEATMKVGKIGRRRPERDTPAAPHGKRDGSRAAVSARRERLREMAAEGHSSHQVAVAIGVSEEGCRAIAKEIGVEFLADRALSRAHRHDSSRIVEHIVIDAENLTADAALINFSQLDREKLGEWIDTLNKAKQSLSAFIRRLVKEHEKHVEAA